mmetsp:Transcript_15153/g.32883  ORF Transcript_15153/g.32883 Transcript_15153/m.32883 type:complete len:433 (-) Transcript_15153:285-1583(-)
MQEHQVRDLNHAAKMYAQLEDQARSKGQMPDYDTLYSHGLVLQELAAKSNPSSAEHRLYLQQACDLYEASLQVRPSSHAALYNWGVALTDLARVVRMGSTGPSQPSEADSGMTAVSSSAVPHVQLQMSPQACLALASQKYAQALKWQPNNPQALNNWGLVLQEMSAHAQQHAERDRLVQCALEKFRCAIRMRPDFDRGCYNLGTVCYTYASTLQAELSAQYRGIPANTLDSEGLKQRQAKEAEIRTAFTTAAQYICLAYALQQHKDIYRKSLGVVRSMLPLPFLRAGHLLAPLPGTLGTSQEAWRRDWFVLDQASLRAASSMETSLSSSISSGLVAMTQLHLSPSSDPPLVIPLTDMYDVRRVDDVSLPAGHALWVGLHSDPLGIYLIAEDAASADTWVDALLLCHYIALTRSPEALSEALTPAHKRVSIKE